MNTIITIICIFLIGSSNLHASWGGELATGIFFNFTAVFFASQHQKYKDESRMNRQVRDDSFNRYLGQQNGYEYFNWKASEALAQGNHQRYLYYWSMSMEYKEEAQMYLKNYNHFKSAQENAESDAILYQIVSYSMAGIGVGLIIKSLFSYHKESKEKRRPQGMPIKFVVDSPLEARLVYQF